MNSFNFKSYFKFLSRNKGYTAVNLIGFSISLMFVILLSLYIKSETQVDQFHENKDRIYRLVTNEEEGVFFPAQIAVDLKNRYPEIEAFVRIDSDENILKVKDEYFRAHTLYADSSFFQVFSFPAVEGIPESMLRTKLDAVLTESFAIQLFGNEPALGKTFQIEDLTYTVNGVVKDFSNTHFNNPGMIIRLEQGGEHYLSGYWAFNYMIYLLIQENTNFTAKLNDANEYLRSYFNSFVTDPSLQLELEPLSDCYFSPKNPSWTDIFIVNDLRFILILGAIAFVVLLFAVINYINLSVAQSGFRAKEAATRRLLGGSRNSLFLNYITETILFCTGAFILGIFFAYLAEPVFNRLLASNISVSEMLSLTNILTGVLFVILLGGLSGIIPALVISRFKPIEVVKGSFKRRSKMVYSKVFICFQFCITIILLGSTITIIRQTRFMRETDLGFKKEHLIYMDNELPNKRCSGLRDKLMQVPGVKMVSFSAGTPINGGNNRTVTYENLNNKTISFQILESDNNFLEILDLEVVHTTGIKSDTAVWINQTAFNELGLTEKDDMFQAHKQMALAGVVKDFNISNASEKIAPVIVIPKKLEERWAAGIWDILVKIDSDDPAKTYKQVLSTYLQYNGGMPVNSGFVDAKINSWYDVQERSGKIIGYFALLAIIISALGLLAMATYFMRQRALDVAVRKIFGSTNEEILKRLIFSFMKIVLVSFVIAIPVIWYVMNQWLQEYAYRIRIDWTIFAVAGGIAFVIAFITVFWQSYKATNANPILSLKKD